MGFTLVTPMMKEVNLITQVEPNDKKILKYISAKKSGGGRGGMKSKLNVAMIAADKGIETHIANGKREHIVLDILGGMNVGTKFLARTN